MTDVDAIFQSLSNILDALLGQRLFRPDYPGESLEGVLFELIDAATSITVMRIVRTAVTTWEPRVKLAPGQSKVTPDPDNNRYKLLLVFTIKGYGDQRFEMQGSLSK